MKKAFLVARCRWLVAVGLGIAVFPASAQESGNDQPLFTMDETVWATFYDLPSRRFRAIRDAFIRKDFASAERDLLVSIGFLSVEADRAVDVLDKPIAENIATFEQLHRNLRDATVSTGDLDAAFARAHWLLSQHYLLLALDARDNEAHRNAGRYLWATAHHVERAVLWSDARVDRSIVSAIESIREMASWLQSSDQPERVYRDRPIAATARLLLDVGEHLDRKVWVANSLPRPSAERNP